MKSVFAFEYCDGHTISSSERILFECPNDPKVVIISEEMSLYSLRKIIMDVIEGCIILLDLFYRQPVYIGDGYVEYECIELNTTMVWEKYFSSFRNVSKGLINLNATFS